MTINSEFLAGEKNGMKHGEPISGTAPEVAAFLYRQNIEKAKAGSMAEEPLIRAYWQGYLSGLDKKEKNKSL